MSQESSLHKMHFLDIFKKFKSLRLFEPSLVASGFFFIITIFIIFSFFCLDYKAVIKGGSGFSVQSQGASGGKGFSWLIFERKKVKKIEFLSEERNKCDLFEGDWVWDDNYPLYQSTDCKFLDDGFKCSQNGRPDVFYTKWRWQPKDCDLPRFDAKKMLENLRNKRVVFAGDSIGRNQWESLLCMLSSAIPNNKKEEEDSVYEVNGNPITKHKGFLIFKFRDYNCTLEYYRAPFLVLQSRPPKGNKGKDVGGVSAAKMKTTLKLDQMDWESSKWRDADVLVLNTAHWWNFEKTLRGGCYFQEGSEVKMDMEVEKAYEKALHTVIHWIQHEVNTSKTHVVFRTYSPVHFRGGDWRTGGSCQSETLPELGYSLVPSNTWTKYTIFQNLISSSYNNSILKSIDILNTTHMSARRKDGHSSVYYLGPNNKGHAPQHRQDCSHWCLPGVPDSWNELLYAMFMKRRASTSRKSLESRAMS